VPEGLREEAVRDASTVNGIDYLEVLPGQRKLEVHFLHPLPGQPDEVPVGGTTLTKNHVVIEGGDRVRGLRALGTATSGQVLTVTTSGPGTSRVPPAAGRRRQRPDTGRVRPAPEQLEFSFKAGCPTRFDCRRDETCPPTLLPSTVRDYLAKDYESFRRQMVDRISAAVPGWDDNPADAQGRRRRAARLRRDRLSYEQDAVATEAYLGTARRRMSVRRHARLLGYRMHEGCGRADVRALPVTSAQTVRPARGSAPGPTDDGDVQVFESCTTWPPSLLTAGSTAHLERRPVLPAPGRHQRDAPDRPPVDPRARRLPAA
jgi:hypothetical protein